MTLLKQTASVVSFFLVGALHARPAEAAAIQGRNAAEQDDMSGDGLALLAGLRMPVFEMGPKLKGDWIKSIYQVPGDQWDDLIEFLFRMSLNLLHEQRLFQGQCTRYALAAYASEARDDDAAREMAILLDLRRESIKSFFIGFRGMPKFLGESRVREHHLPAFRLLAEAFERQTVLGSCLYRMAGCVDPIDPVMSQLANSDNIETELARSVRLIAEEASPQLVSAAHGVMLAESQLYVAIAGSHSNDADRIAILWRQYADAQLTYVAAADRYVTRSAAILPRHLSSDIIAMWQTKRFPLTEAFIGDVSNGLLGVSNSLENLLGDRPPDLDTRLASIQETEDAMRRLEHDFTVQALRFGARMNAGLASIQDEYADLHETWATLVAAWLVKYSSFSDGLEEAKAAEIEGGADDMAALWMTQLRRPIPLAGVANVFREN